MLVKKAKGKENTYWCFFRWSTRVSHNLKSASQASEQNEQKHKLRINKIKIIIKPNRKWTDNFKRRECRNRFIYTIPYLHFVSDALEPISVISEGVVQQTLNMQ